MLQSRAYNHQTPQVTPVIRDHPADRPETETVESSKWATKSGFRPPKSPGEGHFASILTRVFIVRDDTGNEIQRTPHNVQLLTDE